MAEPTEKSLADLAKRGRDIYDLWSVAQSTVSPGRRRWEPGRVHSFGSTLTLPAGLIGPVCWAAFKQRPPTSTSSG